MQDEVTNTLFTK